ncbi:MAG: AAA family ATPase [Firmicutes bacterium]|nr:AAA family ATPase [Bacillota bacterium]
MPSISFSRCNKAVICAPNGVMKSSLAQVLDDISKGKETTDRIFTNVISSYSVTHYTSQYIFSSANRGTVLTPTDRIYVIKTFSDSFEFTKETVGTLLADEATRNTYNVLMAEMSGEIHRIEERLRVLTGLTKPQIKPRLIEDLDLAETSDWTDIFESLNQRMRSRQQLPFLEDCKYSELFNDKVKGVYSKPEFVNSIEDYINQLNTLLTDNPVLSETFTDQNAETLGKNLEKNDLFSAHHTIHLKDGETVIHSLDEWKRVVNEQLTRLYNTPELSRVFQKLKKMLTANADVLRLRDIIAAHREIIPMFRDIKSFKIQVWLDCFVQLDLPFEDYYSHMSQYTERIRSLYEQAAAQSERWQSVVDEFNRRFRVPFKVCIENKANFLLKDEAPNLTFEYSRGPAQQETASLKKDELMVSLSTGEKRALYLLYILFDLEKIRKQAVAGGGQFLIVADDVADSFDYKNKYAIIEYLNDLGNTPGIDLLMLTHNFDFYRTVKSRLGIARNNCFVAQRDENGTVTMTVFKYQRDFFKNVVIEGIKTGQITDDEKKKLLISSIPFYRNLCEYSGQDTKYNQLTCFLHLKTSPFDTTALKISDLWDVIKPFLNNQPFSGTDELYCDALYRIASDCVGIQTNEVLLDNKLAVSIASRLKAEQFLKNKITGEGLACSDSASNQTREWFNTAVPFLTHEQQIIIEDLNLMTPESIHLNSFMFEPLIDVSDWSLKELYRQIQALQ